MQKCTLTLVTMADGRETRETHQAEVEVEQASVCVRYLDGVSSVFLSLSKGEATIERVGDYAMRLPLKSGTKTQGSLSVAGATGELHAFTKAVDFAVKTTGILFRLDYQLLFEEEKQEMRVSGRAQINGER